jgi:hypothetical protein
MPHCQTFNVSSLILSCSLPGACLTLSEGCKRLHTHTHRELGLTLHPCASCLCRTHDRPVAKTHSRVGADGDGSRHSHVGGYCECFKSRSLSSRAWQSAFTREGFASASQLSGYASGLISRGWGPCYPRQRSGHTDGVIRHKCSIT